MPEHQQTQQSKKSESSFQRRPILTNQSHISNPASIIQRARIDPKSLTPADVLQLQRTIGNRAVGRLLSEVRNTSKVQQVPIQRQKLEHEETCPSCMQKQEIPEEEEPLKGKMADPIQRQEIPEEEEPLQGKMIGAVQRQEIPEEEEPLQTKRKNNTGMPDNLKSGVESLSGIDMSDVRVHYNSSKPAEVGALAYTQGTNIHVAPGQERHLPHEAWHVIQQKQGRVKTTLQLKDIQLNDDKNLEREADLMGTLAISGIQSAMLTVSTPIANLVRFQTLRGLWNGNSSQVKQAMFLHKGKPLRDIRSILKKLFNNSKDSTPEPIFVQTILDYTAKHEDQTSNTNFLEGWFYPKLDHNGRKKEDEPIKIFIDELERGIYYLPDKDEALKALLEAKVSGGIQWDDIADAVLYHGSKIEDEGEFTKFLKNVVNAMFKAIDGEKKTKDGNIPKTFPDNQNQTKFPSTPRQRNRLKSAAGSPGVEIREARKYESSDDKIIMQLRWISTTLYKYLRENTKETEEVQSLWDGTTLYITANEPENNAVLEAFLSKKEGLSSFLRTYNNEGVLDPFVRHPSHVNKKRGKTEYAVIHALYKHIEKIPNGKTSNVTVIKGEDTKHAEIRLVGDMVEKYKKESSNPKTEKPPKLYVAGVKRPCFACFVRLKGLKEDYTKLGGDLIFNPHKGLLWPTKNAFHGISSRDRRKALEELGVREFCEYKKDKTTDVLKKFYTDNPYNLNEGNKYDQTTPSLPSTPTTIEPVAEEADNTVVDSSKRKRGSVDQRTVRRKRPPKKRKP